MNEAYKKVCANKGAGGVDGMETRELDGYIREKWDSTACETSRDKSVLFPRLPSRFTPMGYGYLLGFVILS